MKLFKTQSELETHTCRTSRRVSGKEKTHKCDTCGRMFGRKDQLTQHIRVVHDKMARHSCPYCKYRTHCQRNLTRHIATHTGDKMFKCTVCDYTAVRKECLTEHIYRQHTNKTYRCQYKQCGVKKPSEPELHAHMRNEHPVQRNRCDICPMSFNRAAHLTQHKRSHRELDSRLECRYCGKQFTQSGSLKRHSLTHTGERPHKCSVCGRGFTQRSSLTAHMRIHTGEKPFSCSYCDKGFTRCNTRASHEITCRSKTC